MRKVNLLINKGFCKTADVGCPSEKARQEAYSSLFRTHLDKNSLRLIRDGTQQGTVFGGAHFQEEIKVMVNCRVMKHEHGGDRKSRVFKEISSDLIP